MDQKIDKNHPAIPFLTQWKKKIKMNVSDFQSLAHLGTPEVATLKIDGEQTGLYYRDGNVELISRHGKVRTGLPCVDEAAKLLKGHKSALFVCELYVVDESGNNVPYPKAITTLRKPNPGDEERINLSVIDLIELDGKVDFNYQQAVDEIMKIFTGGNFIHPVNIITDLKKEWDENVATNKYEGFVLHYPGKVIKVKPVLSFDLAVVMVEPSDKHPDMAGALGLAFMDSDGNFRLAGKVGTGLSQEERIAWLKWAKDNTIRQDGNSIWVTPAIVVEVAAKGYNVRGTSTLDSGLSVIGHEKSAVLREPSLKGVREDKTVSKEDLRLEQIPDWGNLKSNSWLYIDNGIRVQCGYPKHPDTIIIQPSEHNEAGITEKDVWEYYDSVADKMIPLLSGFNVLIKKVVESGPVIIRHDPKTHDFIRIDTREQFDRFNDGRSVEFHRAIEKETNLAWIDIDPHGYPEEKTKQAIAFIKDHIHNVMETIGIEVIHTGGRGYHIHLKLEHKQNVDKLRNTLQDWLEKEVVPNFENTSTRVIKGEGTLRFDVSTLKATGSIRCPYSLNAVTGKPTMPYGDDIIKSSSIDVVSYIVHMPGHKNSKGDPSPWVIKSHDDNHIIGSYPSKDAAEKALKRMRYFKHKSEAEPMFNRSDIYKRLIQAMKPAVSNKELAKKWRKDEKEIEAAIAEGAEVELEHTESKEEAMQIASHHLEEFLDYYKELKKMEKRLKKKASSERYNCIYIRLHDKVIGEDHFNDVMAGITKALRDAGFTKIEVDKGDSPVGRSIFVWPKTNYLDQQIAAIKDISEIQKLRASRSSAWSTVPILDLVDVEPCTREYTEGNR